MINKKQSIKFQGDVLPDPGIFHFSQKYFFCLFNAAKYNIASRCMLHYTPSTKYTVMDCASMTPTINQQVHGTVSLGREVRTV